MMKSQAVAFFLGFALTSAVLLFVPGISKRTSQAGNSGDNKLAGVIGIQNAAAGDSTSVTTGHLNSIPIVVNP